MQYGYCLDKSFVCYVHTLVMDVALYVYLMSLSTYVRTYINTVLFICYSIVEFNFALETFGVNSHCIEHNSRWRVQTVTGKSVQSSSWGAGCYNVSCLHIHCSCRYCYNVYYHSQTFTKQLLGTHIQAIQYIVNTAHALAIAA